MGGVPPPGPGAALPAQGVLNGKGFQGSKWGSDVQQQSLEVAFLGGHWNNGAHRAFRVLAQSYYQTRQLASLDQME